mgnify:CR=1 FL=1
MNQFKPIKSLKEIPVKEQFAPGHRLCAGCTIPQVVRLALKAVPDPKIVVNATGCLEVATTIFPYTSWKIPWVHNAFENAAATAGGIEAAFRILEKKRGIKKPKIIVFGGDGGTFDIGLQALSGALERGHDLIYICYDNEAYMNTGIQRSGATPPGAWTTTTPKGKRGLKKDVPSIIAAHKVPYVATGNPAYPLDLLAKLEKAKKIRGLKYIHLLSPCPPGWRFPSDKTVEVARLAVQTGMWILYEVEHGVFRLTGPSRALLDKEKRRPVAEYLRMQGRFAHLTNDQIEEIQREVDEEWERIAARLEQ